MAEGLYFVQTWLLQMIPQFEAELTKGPAGTGNGQAGGDSQSDSVAVDPYEFASFGDDFLPFVAKN